MLKPPGPERVTRGDAPAVRSLAGGTALIVAARASTIAANAIVSIVAARLLGPEGTGVLAVGLALQGVLMVGCGLGLAIGTSWQVGAGVWGAHSALVSTRAASLALGLAAAAVGTAAFVAGRGNVFEGLPALGAVAVLLAVPAAMIWSHAANVAVAMQRYEVGLAIPATQAAGYVVAVGALAAVWGVAGALVGLLVSQALGAVLALAWSRAAFGSESAPPIDWQRLRQAFAFGAAAWVGQLLALTVQRTDLFILSATGTREEVGHYAIAVAVTTPLWLMPTGLSAVLLPRLAGLGVADGRSAGHGLEERALRHVVLLLVAGAALVAVLVAALLPALYGPDFSAARVPALILLPGTVLLGLAHVATASLVGRGHPLDAMRTWLIVLPLAAALYLALVPSEGARGAAAASTVAYSIAAVVSLAFLSRRTGVSIWRGLLPGRAEVREYRGFGRQVRALVRRGVSRGGYGRD